MKRAHRSCRVTEGVYWVRGGGGGGASVLMQWAGWLPGGREPRAFTPHLLPGLHIFLQAPSSPSSPPPTHLSFLGVLTLVISLTPFCIPVQHPLIPRDSPASDLRHNPGGFTQEGTPPPHPHAELGAFGSLAEGWGPEAPKPSGLAVPPRG